MTQEEKQLLLIDLCARLPYGVKGKLYNSNYTAILKDVRYSCFYPLLVRPLECPLTNDECSLGVDEFRPYLRPMSSMTVAEEYEYHQCKNIDCLEISEMEHAEMLKATALFFSRATDWLLANHFDFRGLIPLGLALEAPEGMYNKN